MYNLQIRHVTNYKKLFMPAPGDGKNYRFKVLYPEDKVYTCKPIKMQKLAGRDPVTGKMKDIDTRHYLIFLCLIPNSISKFLLTNIYYFIRTCYSWNPWRRRKEKL